MLNSKERASLLTRINSKWSRLFSKVIPTVSYSRLLFFFILPPPVSKRKEESVNHHPPVHRLGRRTLRKRGKRGSFHPAKRTHISKRCEIPRNSVSTISETLRINLYGESRRDSKRRNKACEDGKGVERRTGREKIVWNSRGTRGGRSDLRGIHRLDGDRRL